MHPLLREKVRIAGDIPSLDVLDMIEREFQPLFKGRLEIDLMEDQCGYLQHIYRVKEPNLKDIWYLDHFDESF